MHAPCSLPFLALENRVEFNEADHPALDRQDTTREAPIKLGRDIRRRLNIAVGNGQYVGNGIDQQADHLAVDLRHDDHVPNRRLGRRHPETRGEIDDRQHRAAQIDDAEHIGRRMAVEASAMMDATDRSISPEMITSAMSEAEKKAAALPPKLTVPMILFFLPVLFAVIITPAVIQIMTDSSSRSSLSI